MSFTPQVDQILSLGGRKYRFLQHPAAPKFVYGQTGRFGTVYAVSSPSGEWRAFKVFTARFQDRRYADTAERLQSYATLSALRVCERLVVTPEQYADVLVAQPDLKYAVLMPWVTGQTWMEILYARTDLSRAQCHGLATSLTRSLAQMEFWGIAHCDLSNTNVVLTRQPVGLGFVDVEGMYAPGLGQPRVLTAGSPGYAHRSAPAALWGPESDRFSGAVLVAEMLGWCDPAVRANAFESTYFDPDEMPRASANGSAIPRLDVLLNSLHRNWGTPVADAFARAWDSDTLADCPPMTEWDRLIKDAVPASAVSVLMPTDGPARGAGPETPPPPTSTSWAWLGWVLVGLLILLFVMIASARH